jgi:hypothetical protein
MSIEKHYRPAALEYYKAHVNEPELEERRHIVPQVAAAVVALLGLAGVALLFIDRLPTWKTVDVVCNSGHAIVLDIPVSSRRIVYREGSESIASDLVTATPSQLSAKANFRLDERADSLCKIGRQITVKAIAN